MRVGGSIGGQGIGRLGKVGGVSRARGGEVPRGPFEPWEGGSIGGQGMAG